MHRSQLFARRTLVAGDPCWPDFATASRRWMRSTSGRHRPARKEQI